MINAVSCTSPTRTKNRRLLDHQERRTPPLQLLRSLGVHRPEARPRKVEKPKANAGSAASASGYVQQGKGTRTKVIKKVLFVSRNIPTEGRGVKLVNRPRRYSTCYQIKLTELPQVGSKGYQVCC